MEIVAIVETTILDKDGNELFSFDGGPFSSQSPECLEIELEDYEAVLAKNAVKISYRKSNGEIDNVDCRYISVTNYADGDIAVSLKPIVEAGTTGFAELAGGDHRTFMDDADIWIGEINYSNLK